MAVICAGSLQCKRGWWYFVQRAGGKAKWLALKTRDRTEAEDRAKKMFPAEALRNDREKYLAALVEQGDKARAELAGLHADRRAQAVTWDGLFDAWAAAEDRLTAHVPTLENYRYSVEAMARWAREAGAAAPADVSAGLAQAWSAAMAQGRVSAGRDLKLFSRVWRGLDMPDVWSACRVRSAKAKDRYRRLSLEEIRRLVKIVREGHEPGKVSGHWTKESVQPKPDVADLIAMGYYTGLRRGDCARLTAAHIEAGGEFLRIVAEKTAGRKGAALLIPLIPEARELAARLASAADPDDGLLFPRLAGAWLGKGLRLAFARAKVGDNESGHASFHSLRATFISAMDEAGIPPHVTDAITGHAPAGMHGRYSQPGREALMAAAVKAIAPLDL